MKWAAVLVVAVLFAFVAGMLLASGPVQVRVAEAPPSAAPPSPSAAPMPTAIPSPPDASVAAAEAPTATSTITASAAASTSEPAPSAPMIDDGPDGSELPRSRGYLIVHCPERPELRAYLVGKVVKLGKRVRVRCGLVNVRLGTFPLGTWYGLGRAVPVACQAVTEVTLKPGKPIDPGRERDGEPAPAGASAEPPGSVEPLPSPPAAADANDREDAYE
jgi:hypothetical protein